VSASLNAKINALNTDTASQASRLSNLETKSGSVDTSITNLNSFTQSFSQSVATEFSASNASIASVTGDFSSSVATSFSQSNASLTSLSASVSTVTGNFSASIGQEQINQDSKLNSLISFTGSYATTGSNTFKGTQTISGSTYIQGDLIVLGTSSMQNITGSSVSIGTNTVILNTSNPAVRFGGISVQDSGSTGTTGSLWWDSQNNNWIYENPSGSSYTSAKLISGPQNSGSLGNEIGLTTGKIIVAVGDDHIGDSIINQTTNHIGISGSLETSGSFSLTDVASTFNIVGNGFGQTYLQSLNGALVLNPGYGGVEIVGANNRFTAADAYITNLYASNGVISGSSQLTSSYDTRYVVSGSITQTTWDNIANKPSDIISGAAQVTGSLDFRYRLVGTDITFSELSGKPALISSSLQFNNINSPFTGSFTGSFIGNGSLLTGLTAGGKIHTQTTAQSTWTFIHNLNVQYPNVTVYNLEGQIVLPQSITSTDLNTLVLEFGTTVAGYATAGIGGIIEVQGRTVRQYFASAIEWEFEHNLGDRFVNIQTFDSNYEKIIPETIVLTDNLTSTITFPEATSGWAIGTIGGDLPSISSAEAGYTLQVSNTSPYTASWVAIPDVVVSNSLTASYLNPISQSLVPAISGAYDLGSVNKPWRHIYVGTGSIYLVDNSGQITNTLSAETIVTTDTLNDGVINLVNSLPTGVVSGSSQVVSILGSLNNYTGSNDTKWANISNVTSSLITATASYATTGSNSFYGTQVFSGSVFIANDLIVQGSSSIQYISASSVSIGTNIVQLNTATPSVRFAGMSVQDSGSSAGITGSMLWDSLCNRWIYSNPSTIGYSGGMLLSGPRTQTLGTEPTLTCNYIAKSGGGDHLYDSCIIDDGTTVCINANLKGTGTACFTGALTAGTIGTNDLMLSNLNYECANYVDGTRGSWLIQEGENDLFIINQISCKKYKFNLIEIK
jgi:hypothetical protein